MSRREGVSSARRAERTEATHPEESVEINVGRLGVETAAEMVDRIFERCILRHEVK